MWKYRWKLNLYRVILLVSLISLTLTLASGCSALPGFDTEPSPEPTPANIVQPTYDEVFEALWEAVKENYVYTDFGGINWDAVHQQYFAQVKAATSDEQFASLMKAMLGELPEGTAIYETRDERIEAETTASSRFEGIGAFVAFRDDPDPRVVLLAIMPDSPAEQAGLQAHDSLLAIDSLPIQAAEGLQVVQRIRGPAGTQVNLTVRSPDSQIRDVIVTRGQVTTTASLQASFIPNAAIAYFLFPPVTTDTLINDFAQAYATVSSQGLKGLILDLRIASARPGWPLEQLLAAYADGEAGEFYTRQETSPVIIEGQDIANSQRLPITILIGPDTDGMPEVFAAIMQAIGRAKTIGLPTQGEIELFSEFQLLDGSRLLITTGSYRTPAGIEVGIAGITPDITVEADWDAVSPSNDPVLEAAIEWLIAQQ